MLPVCSSETPTFFLLLGHDGVAEGQQSEEGVHLGVLQLHRLHQGVVVEHEARIGQRVEGEVHPVCVLDREKERPSNLQCHCFHLLSLARCGFIGFKIVR